MGSGISSMLLDGDSGKFGSSVSLTFTVVLQDQYRMCGMLGCNHIGRVCLSLENLSKFYDG